MNLDRNTFCVKINNLFLYMWMEKKERKRGNEKWTHTATHTQTHFNHRLL